MGFKLAIASLTISLSITLWADEIEYSVSRVIGAELKSTGDGIIDLEYKNPSAMVTFTLNLYVQKGGRAARFPTRAVTLQARGTRGIDPDPYVNFSPASVSFRSYGTDPTPSDPNAAGYTGIPGGWYLTVFVTINAAAFNLKPGDDIDIRIQADTSGIPHLGSGHGIRVTLSRTIIKFTETFSTDAYKDASQTTAEWDTCLGQLRLKKSQDDKSQGDCITNFAPSLVNRINLRCSRYHRSKVQGNLLFAMGGYGVDIFDITARSKPVYITTIHSYVPGSYFAWMTDIAISGNTLAISCYGYYNYRSWFGALIFNISNIYSPSLASTINSCYGQSLDIKDNVLYMRVNYGLLRAYDISNISRPYLIGVLNRCLYGNTLRIFEDKAYLDGYWKLYAINISDPRRMSVVGELYTWTPNWQMVKNESYLYVASMWYGLRIFNVKDPTRMSVVSSYRYNWLTCWDVAVKCNLVFAVFSINYDPLITLDVKDPYRPRVISIFEPFSGFLGLTLSLADNYAYAIGFYRVSWWVAGSAIAVIKLGDINSHMPAGTAQSININSGKQILRARISAIQTVPAGTWVYYQFSNNGGSSWVDASPGVDIYFTRPTGNLRWRALLGTSNSSFTPIVDEIAIEYELK